ncbi:Copine-8 [Aphelenchoides avenae]|nr:Copine-8 [Aphelenchus avenae]
MSAYPRLTTTEKPSTKVELVLSARHLADKDVFSKSDPMCVVFRQIRVPNQSIRYEEIGRTERIINSLNPQWDRKIAINYYFEEKQPLHFELYDKDSSSNELTEHDFLGAADIDLADIVAAPEGAVALPLKGISSRRSTLVVRAEEVDEGQKESLYIVCHGRNLDKKDLFGKSDPFLEFYRFLDNGRCIAAPPPGTYNCDFSRLMVHRTEFISKTLNPEWKPFEISVGHLCHGDKDREFMIDCYDYDKDGSHDTIGCCRTTVNELASRSKRELDLVNSKKEQKKGDKYKNSGVLHFLDVQLRREYTFLEYISGGLQLEFAVAVDFTASNGDVKKPSSLHYINSQAPNQYEMAISAVLEICEHYNSTKMFEALGFGAKVPPDYQVAHVFPLNVHSKQRNVYGFEGVMSAYRECLNYAQLYGPTNFSPTIREFSNKAASFPTDGTRYQILLIITDGVITDMERTITAIIQASSLPLSIIIVGVGNDSFEKMDELDSDNAMLTLNGRTAQRDIVQFVPFRNFLPPTGVFLSPDQRAQIQAELARAVLAEVPGQVTSYMKSRGIVPKPPPATSIEDIGIKFANNMSVKCSAPPEIHDHY